MVCAEKYVSTNDWSTQRHLTSFSAQLWSQVCTQPLSKPTTLLEAPPPSVLTRPPETLLPGPVVPAPVTATPPLLRAAADDAVTQVVALPKSNTLDTVLCTSPPIFSPPLFFARAHEAWQLWWKLNHRQRKTRSAPSTFIAAIGCS